MNPIPLCKPLPGIANLIALMVITKICSAYNNPVRRKIYIWKKADMVRVCVNISHSSFDACYTWDTPIQEFWTACNDKVQQLMTNRIPLKWSTTWYDQTRENTAIQWLKKKAFTNLVRETKSPDPPWKQMKQDTRVDFNIYVLDPSTDLNPKQLYTYVKW